MNHRFDWKWYLRDLNPDKDVNVLTTFSCGGGSSMGYKRAGFHVIGNVEIDPKINAMYVKNHHPKYNYNMDLRKFNELEDLPEELYHLDILDGSPPCFVAGTMVKTNQGYKPIEQVVIGDSVLTHEGRYRKVYNTMAHVADNCYVVKIQGMMPITVTGNHPFYVREMTRDWDGNRHWGDPEWVPASDLVVERTEHTTKRQSYVGFPINQDAIIPMWEGVRKDHYFFGNLIKSDVVCNVDVSSEGFWKFVGAWFGDGWRRKSRKVVYLCCAHGEREWLEDIIKNAGLRACHYSNERTSIRAEIHNAELYAFLEQFGDGAGNKHLTDMVLSLPNNLLEAFMDGYLATDGHYYAEDDKWSCSSISYELILGLQQVVAKLYHQPTGISYRPINTECIEGRKVKSQPSYALRFFKGKRDQQHFIYEDGYLWIPFRHKEAVEGTRTVYNLSVNEDESYTVSNIAVHNCSTFSTVGKREQGWGKRKKFREGQAPQTLDDLFFIFLNTVEKLQPKIVCAENVPGLLTGNAKGYVNMIVKRFRELGYEVQIFSLNAGRMDCPTARHRVFFIANRMGYPKLKLDFHYDEIPFKVAKEGPGKKMPEDSVMKPLVDKIGPNDRNLSDVLQRMTGKGGKYFSLFVVNEDLVCPTFTSGGQFIRYPERVWLSDEDYRNCQTFPQDYDFCGNDVQYVCGMSVPPNMEANIATEIYEQWLKV